MQKIFKIIALLISLTASVVNSQEKLKTPNSEVEDCIKYLVGEDGNDAKYVAEIDKQYIRFLSTYAIKNQDERKRAALCCSFILHSLVGPAKNLESNNGGAFYPLAKLSEDKETKKQEFIEFQRVPFSDTLWWIDLRDYNFTQDAWETAAKLDGYFVTPVVQEQNNGALRLLAGNAILRMDWFITHVTDTTRQRDFDNNFDLYNTFLFAQVQQPKNIDEWRKLFTLDINRARNVGNESGTMVLENRDVARHNRELFEYKTEYGYMYDTYDVKNEIGIRDFFTSWLKNKIIATPPDIFDAGETFGSNILGLQVYALSDGKGNIVNFGDPTVVRHLRDVLGDTRVRTAHSCIDCHANGPLPAENALKDFVNKNGDIYVSSKEDKNRIKRVFLNNRFEDSIDINKAQFAKAIENSNGLSTDLNAQFYIESIKNYNKNVDLERAAFECGVPKEELEEKIKNSKFNSRLKNLIATNKTIPVTIWETRGKDGIPGEFQQAMILLNGLTQITNEYVAQPVKTEQLIVSKDTDFLNAKIKIATVPKGTQILSVLEQRDGWIKFEFNGKIGWIDEKMVRKE